MTAVDAPQTMKSGGTGVRDDIQGLRALAVIAVVVFHAGLALPGGFVGVDIFFVISGFVITASLIREQQRTGSIRIISFYWRRFRRLVPALALVVTVTLLTSSLVLSPLGPQQTAAATGLAAMFSLANVAISLTTGDYFDSAAELNPLLHTWTLSVEEQFYLVFPVALVVAGVLLKSFRRGVGVVLVAGTVLSFGLTMATPWLLTIYATEFLGFYSPITRAWEFGVGALVAWWVVFHGRQLSRLLARSAYVVGFILIGLSFSPLSEMYVFPGPITLLPVLGTALVIFAGTTQVWGQTDPLRTRLAVAIGDLSYSIYLWHWPFISLAKVIWPDSLMATVTAATMSIVPAVISYHFVEQRFRRRDIQTLRHTASFIAATLLAPVALAIALWLVSNHFSNQMGDATERPAGYELGCHGPGLVNSPLEVCELGPEPSNGSTPVYLVGDSHAAHFTSGLHSASTTLGRPLLAMHASGCPLLDGVYPDPGKNNEAEECAAWQEKVFDYLESASPGVVILGSFDEYWVEPRPMASTNGPTTTDLREKAVLLERGLGSAIARLTATGHEVIVVQTVPVWRGEYDWRLDECTFWETLTGCNQTMPLTDARASDLDLPAITEQVASQSGATTVDFSEAICPNELCQTYAGGVWVYRDYSHLTNAFSDSLQDRWVELFEAR